jgi:hypothetical protein
LQQRKPSTGAALQQIRLLLLERLTGAGLPSAKWENVGGVPLRVGQVNERGFHWMFVQQKM